LGPSVPPILGSLFRDRLTAMADLSKFGLRRAMIRLLATLTLSFMTSGAGQGKRTIDEIHLRATVQDVVLLTHFSGKIILVDFDPRFALTVRIESVDPAATNFTVGADEVFGIHSPSLLFGEEAKGKTYDFTVQREVKHGKTRYFGLKVDKVQKGT